MVLLLLACTPDEADSAPTGTLDDTGSPGPSASTTWYFGTSDGEAPDGSYDEAPKEILFIRALDPEAATVTEDAWQQGTARQWDHYMLVHDVDVAAGTFSSLFETPDGTMDVQGGYDAGAPWAWTAWHSTSTYLDGRYTGTVVESVDEVDADGVAQAHKEVWDASGAHTWSIVETLTPTDQVSFEERLAQIEG